MDPKVSLLGDRMGRKRYGRASSLGLAIQRRKQQLGLPWQGRSARQRQPDHPAFTRTRPSRAALDDDPGNRRGAGYDALQPSSRRNPGFNRCDRPRPVRGPGVPSHRPPAAQQADGRGADRRCHSRCVARLAAGGDSLPEQPAMIALTRTVRRAHAATRPLTCTSSAGCGKAFSHRGKFVASLRTRVVRDAQA